MKPPRRVRSSQNTKNSTSAANNTQGRGRKNSLEKTIENVFCILNSNFFPRSPRISQCSWAKFQVWWDENFLIFIPLNSSDMLKMQHTTTWRLVESVRSWFYHERTFCRETSPAMWKKDEATNVDSINCILCRLREQIYNMKCRGPGWKVFFYHEKRHNAIIVFCLLVSLIAAQVPGSDAARVRTTQHITT